AMWRAPNIYLDISQLHVRDSLGLFTEEFGSERILFGIGPKQQYGASLAALAHSSLTEDQIENISHKNLERLLKIEPVTKRLASRPLILDEKPLWNAIRTGKPIVGTEIIDAHGHTPPHTRGWIIREQTLYGGSDELINTMDRLGVDKIILSPEAALFGDNLPGNRQGNELFIDPKYKGRFYGYLVYNPLYENDMVPELDNFFSSGNFVGFKVLPDYWRIKISDPRLNIVWEYANKHHLPTLIHYFEGGNYTTAKELDQIASSYPNAVLILGHSGGSGNGRISAEELAIKHENVYLEFCGSFMSERLYETTLQVAGKHKILFGSDAVAHDLAWELGRYLSMPIPDSELTPGLAENFRRIVSASKLKLNI
ncbi:MAG: amidohydrolase family protein, partial [Lentisphaerae bacterium]|nr:amidohydrolase family protein [Lentisphaerota bacterium]